MALQTIVRPGLVGKRIIQEGWASYGKSRR